MRPFHLPILLALALAPAAAPAQDWRQSREHELVVSNFDISPGEIRLRAGEPVRLRLINRSDRGHSLSAPALFAAAKLRNRDKASMSGGSVNVGAGEVRELLLVPAPGRYKLRSGNFLYRLLGMSSEIVVE
jgi:uncharacterized cupredoxin-like copper-binding protein